MFKLFLPLDQWIQAILLVKNFKLVPKPLDEGPRPKSGKLRLILHGTCFGGKFGLDQKIVLKGELLYVPITPPH
jgi:hypothetical protein